MLIMNNVDDDLKNYRNEIDKLDKEILTLLKKRFAISLQVAKCKQENNLPINQSNRENEILTNLSQGEDELTKSMIKAIWAEIFTFSKKLQHLTIKASKTD